MKDRANRTIATLVLTLFGVAVLARCLGNLRQSWSSDPWARIALWVCIALLVASDIGIWLHVWSDICSAFEGRPQDFSLRSAPLSSDSGRDLDV
jgi:hypothetical protein